MLNFINPVVYTVNSEIFARILFSRIAFRHIFDAQNSRLRHDLPISVNNRVGLLFREGFASTKLCICEVLRKKALAKISEFTLDCSTCGIASWFEPYLRDHPEFWFYRDVAYAHPPSIFILVTAKQLLWQTVNTLTKCRL